MSSLEARSVDIKKLEDGMTSRKLDEQLTPELNFLFEAGYLKRLKRSGWILSGINPSESVAEHVFRTAVIGFVLACLEGADAEKVTVACLFHDIQETRVSDLNPLTKNYHDQTKTEARARVELLSALDERVSIRINDAFKDASDEKNHIGLLVRDADLLECILQAHEYRLQGFAGADNFLIGPSRLELGLRSDSAKSLAKHAQHVSPSEWWKTLT